MTWLRNDHVPVPINIAATGPKVVALGAVLADGVSLSVGADPQRVAAAVSTARSAREQAGLDPADLRLGAYLNVAVHDDPEIAARITSGKLASFSRFSVMHGEVTGFASGADRDDLAAFSGTYDMTAHGRSDATHTSALTTEFASRNAAIGPAKVVLERLWQLRELGVERFILTEDFSREAEAGESHRSIVEDVLPELMQWS